MAEEPLGIIGEATENDMPVIYRFVNKLPAQEIRAKLPWLLVISWKYEGQNNNGMPLQKVNEKMIKLEDGIESIANIRHAYSRTGNNLTEFVYYISERDAFMKSFNNAMTGQEKYPITITFYKDTEWHELAKLIKDFDKKPIQNAANK